MVFEHKLVAIINKNLEPGVALNALAHMTIGLGAQLNNYPLSQKTQQGDSEKTVLSAEQILKLDTYKDANGNQYPNISQMPFIILRGTSNEIKKAVIAAREKQIRYGVFLNTMTGGTYLEQLDNTEQTPEDDLIFYGTVLFGPSESVSTITKKFSLFK